MYKKPSRPVGVRIVMRAKAEIETVKDRETIIVTEIPYQVNKAQMIERTAELVGEKKIRRNFQHQRRIQ
jgi:DNA gyrase/topoisomerase IV subunit A